MTGGRRREARWLWIAHLIAYLCVGVVMMAVPGGMSGLARLGLWVLICGASSLKVVMMLRFWD